jgi:hypothetical protein
MKVYLVWERESYCDYDVVFISFDDIKAKEVVEQKNTECGYERFSLDEMEFEKFKVIESW